MLNHLTFKNRIAVLVGCAIVGIVMLSAVSAYNTRHTIMESRRDQLRTAVEAAHNIVAGFQARAARGEISEAGAGRARLVEDPSGNLVELFEFKKK